MRRGEAVHKYMKPIILMLIYSLLVKEAVAGESRSEVDSVEMIKQMDADWLNGIMLKHKKSSDEILNISLEYWAWNEAQTMIVERIPTYFWNKFKKNYKGGIDMMKKDINETRKRFAGRNPGCIKALDEFERGYFSEMIDLYNRYASERPRYETIAPLMASYHGGFPHMKCLFERGMTEAVESYNKNKRN